MAENTNWNNRFYEMLSSIKQSNSQSAISIKSSLKGPAYAQLALLIKQKISRGEYQPGARIPSESSIGKSCGVSVMTVRQAIGLLVEQGLLRRVHGSGTFVCGPDWTRANFNMEGLLEILDDRDNLDIRIIKAGIVSATHRAATALEIPEGALVITLVRLVSHRGIPFLLNNAYLKCDPKSPIVESELEASSLSGLFSGQGNSFIKKAQLKLEPSILSKDEADHLKISENPVAAFRIRYIFYDYTDLPVGSGWFMIPRGFMSISTRIGVWDDDD